MPGSGYWDPHIHADRRPALLERGRIKAALRGWFAEQGFTEVECGILQRSPGNEAHLNAFATELQRTDGSRETLYLHTSPEFAAKKLLSAGESRIFEFARVFRNREFGALHAAEFTMLEWYRTNSTYTSVMADCLNLMRLAAATTGQKRFAFRDRACDPFADVQQLTVAEAFLHFAGIDLKATLSAEGIGDTAALASRAGRAGLDAGPDDTWSDIFSKILVARIEPRLGVERPTILCEYPRCEAALARACAHDPRVSERFELYACGVELANGFGELTDPVEQRARFEQEMSERERIYGERYPIDEDFLSALQIMPPSSGVAMGFDRLAMLAIGARTVHDVIWTPLI